LILKCLSLGNMDGEYQQEECSAWSSNRMSAWVQSLCQQNGWHDYSQCFVDHDVDGRCITELTLSLLKEMGVIKIGHRLTLLRELRKLTEPATNRNPTVLCTPTSNQGYNINQQPYQLPIYMPQQSSYSFSTTLQHEDQHQPIMPPVTNSQRYEAQTVEDGRVQYEEPQTENLMMLQQTPLPIANLRSCQDLSVEPSQIHYSDAKFEQMTTHTSNETSKVGAQDPEHPGVDVRLRERQQVYEEDEFPNAQNLETPSSEIVIVHENDIIPQQEVAEHHQQPFAEEEHFLSTERSMDIERMPITSQQIQKEKIAEPARIVQSRPSAWGSKNKLRIAPNAATTSSKLLVQTTRFNKTSTKTPPQDKRYKPGEENSEETHKPTPQIGDILKGTVKRVVSGLGAFVDIAGQEDALLTNKEGVLSFRIEALKTYWVMVKKVVDANPNPKNRRIHLTSFVPGVNVNGTIAHAHPVSGTRQVGFFVNIGWWKPGLLLHKRMRDRNKKKNQQLNNLFVLSHKLKVIRNQQTTAELDLIEIEPQNWKPEDVVSWLKSFFEPDDRLPENLPQLHGKDIFSLTPKILDQIGIADSHKQENILLCVRMMTEQRAYLTQRTKKHYGSSTTSKAKRRSEIPSLPTGDSHFPALGNKGKRR